MTYLKRCCLFFCFSLPIAANAFPTNALHNLDLFVGLGPSWFTANDTNLTLTNAYGTEIDKLNVNNVSSTTMKTAGIGYHLFSDQLASNQYIKDLLAQVNFYRATGAVHGDVWQYQNPLGDTYYFRAPFTSSRLMLDIKPTLFNNAYHIAAYPIVGVGMAWNKLSYNEIANASAPTENYTSLAEQTNRKFAYDLGIGVKYAITQHLNTSIEYINYRLGNTSSSEANAGGVNTSTSSAATFLMHSQSILFNIGYRF